MACFKLLIGVNFSINVILHVNLHHIVATMQNGQGPEKNCICSQNKSVPIVALFGASPLIQRPFASQLQFSEVLQAYYGILDLQAAGTPKSKTIHLRLSLGISLNSLPAP